jgi:hypothetical protein
MNGRLASQTPIAEFDIQPVIKLMEDGKILYFTAGVDKILCVGAGFFGDRWF